MLEVVEQHSTNHASHSKGHILKPKRNANPSKVKAKVKGVRMPTGVISENSDSRSYHDSHGADLGCIV